ncbi:MAG: hypothetical protein NTY90_02780 [Candidatus Micrarchaeota archaeon]|nr:hypothetical protein [Candidatus Micrarchaeota archaeon]
MPKQLPSHRYLKQFITEVTGDRGLKVATCVGDGATDEKIEQKTGIKIAEVRSILNHLHSFGIVEYLREKNLSNGWFTYTWKLNGDRALQNFILFKKKEQETLRKKLAEEAGVLFYKCRKGCSRLPFEQAMDKQFRCPQCKSLMHHVRPHDELRKLEDRLISLEKITSAENLLMKRD